MAHRSSLSRMTDRSGGRASSSINRKNIVNAWRLPRRWAGILTIALLIGAFAVGVVGILRAHQIQYHLVVETVAIVAGITGIYAERRAAAVERRRAAVGAVNDELDKNVAVLEDDKRFPQQSPTNPRPHRFPRLAVTAVETCLANGVLTEDGDSPRGDALRQWLEAARAFNRGLGVSELLFYGLHFAAPEQKQVMVKVDEELQRERHHMMTMTRDAQLAVAF
jgi:hypothetical protein